MRSRRQPATQPALVDRLHLMGRAADEVTFAWPLRVYDWAAQKTFVSTVDMTACSSDT